MGERRARCHSFHRCAFWISTCVEGVRSTKSRLLGAGIQPWRRCTTRHLRESRQPRGSVRCQLASLRRPWRMSSRTRRVRCADLLASSRDGERASSPSPKPQAHAGRRDGRPWALRLWRQALWRRAPRQTPRRAKHLPSRGPAAGMAASRASRSSAASHRICARTRALSRSPAAGMAASSASRCSATSQGT